MKARVKVTGSSLEEALKGQAVLAALTGVAERVAAAAEDINESEGKRPARIWVEAGRRPGGRPRANVYSSDVAGEWGTWRVGRRRTLGRAARKAAG